MPRPRKASSNSITGAKQMMERLKTKIESPIKINDEEQVIFDGIIAGLPQDTWETYRIRLAANLAKMTYRAERLMTELEEEGDVVLNARGTPVCNPITSSMQQALTSVQTLTKTLGLSASQRGISEKEVAPARKAEKAAKEAIDKASGDDLLG